MEEPLACSLSIIIMASVQNLVFFMAGIFTVRFSWRHECLYSSLSAFLVGIHRKTGHRLKNIRLQLIARCDTCHQKTQQWFFYSFPSPACFRWEVWCESLVRSDSSAMGTNYMLLFASVPSLRPQSARHKGEALVIADAVKGDLYCEQVKCYGNKNSEKNQALVLSQISRCF